MVIVTIRDNFTGSTASVETSDVEAALRPRYPNGDAEVTDQIKALAAALHRGEPTYELEASLAIEVIPARTFCGRCRLIIMQGVIAGASQTWVSATAGDPWCHGGAHLPATVHI